LLLQDEEDDFDEGGEEEELDEEDEGGEDEELGEEEQWRQSFLKQRDCQFKGALKKHGVPAEVAASLQANLRTLTAEFSDDGNGDLRTASLRTQLSYGAASGLQLELFNHLRCRWASVEFVAFLKWRPTPRAGAATKWVALGTAWMEDAPDYGHRVDYDDYESGGSIQYEKVDTRMLTAAAVTAMRTALFGDNEVASASVSQGALVALILAASGWHMDRLNPARQSEWLEHAFRAAAGAPLPATSATKLWTWHPPRWIGRKGSLRRRGRRMYGVRMHLRRVGQMADF